ncbi:nad dependent epimerase/dehydratase, putative [Perkinsus marinus ATCC 50983]|uniref:Nad dependent epimerase/dehydratase, putative n=1 Tax=Perkinsus marinus (strain ATCC 50983 / TXsc) TaxID=423536 RepID=C5L445_PERM5|nr:nad dependent epimerase/dehydratase, putative [Perkinsus marinus ATCC 50983]EER08511.1 nad dependent epimerase/dehydratase, putative [Perkinsus marinus ATCC 50983]|eukprot:XP_002776695.1 nad dependent epimerase/dehydratase, putative [Perkinsus marinus ATCC 50983]
MLSWDSNNESYVLVCALLMFQHSLFLLVIIVTGELYQPYVFSEAERGNARGKVVLVTGAAGFIGSHVAKHCRDLGMEVVAIDDLSGGFTSNVPAGVTFLRRDVRDAESMESLFERYKFDYVYHLAAYAAEGLSHFVRSFNYRTNLVGSVEILNAAIRHKVGVLCPIL